MQKIRRDPFTTKKGFDPLRLIKTCHPPGKSGIDLIVSETQPFMTGDNHAGHAGFLPSKTAYGSTIYRAIGRMTACPWKSKRC